MIYSSLAVLTLAASAAVSPFSHLVHFHAKAVPDTRIRVTFVNDTMGFRDVKIDGHSYTIDSHHNLTLKAPAGTVVYADSRGETTKRGDVLLQVSAADNRKTVKLK